MQFQALTRACFILLYLISVTSAWAIDEDSCRDDLEFVKGAIRSAFKLADGANRAVAVSNVGGLSVQLKNLLTWLFVPDTTEDETTRLMRAQSELNSVFGGLSTGSIAEEGSLQGYPNVKFYCNADRFIKRNDDRGRWYDPDAKAVVLLKDERITDAPEGFDPKATCKPPENVDTDQGINEDIAFAFTLVGGTWDTVTICPWFLDYVNKKNLFKTYNLQTWFKAKWMRGRKLLEQVAEKHYTEVDLVSLFDKVILHELMHTEGGKQKVDVGQWEGYGWKNCLELARNDEQGFDNCDSYALFGSCVNLVNEGCQIGQDGSVGRP